MGINSAINWTDHSLNFWTGCKKVSAGCKFCYMYRDKERYGQDPTNVIKVSDKTINKVLKAAKPGDKIFVSSWTDFFIDEADHWRAEAWKIIKSRPDLIFQILTKRIDRVADCLPPDWGENGYPNVWLGVSVEDQEAANKRIPVLLSIPAAIRWLSCEPLLGMIDLKDIQCKIGGFDIRLNALTGMALFPLGRLYAVNKIDWVVIGGESGNDTGPYGYRECKLEWITCLLVHCKLNEIPMWFKQTGTHLAKVWELQSRTGENIDELPPSLQIRQFPVF